MDRNSHGANVAQLPVGSNNPLYLIEATVFLLHAFDGFSHEGAVLWMHEGQILLSRGCSVLWIQPVNFEQLVRPIMTRGVKRPTTHMSKALPFAKIKLALL